MGAGGRQVGWNIFCFYFFSRDVAHREFGVQFVYEEGTLIAHLLVPRRALSGDVQAAVVVHGDGDHVRGVVAARGSRTHEIMNETYHQPKGRLAVSRDGGSSRGPGKHKEKRKKMSRRDLKHFLSSSSQLLHFTGSSLGHPRRCFTLVMMYACSS